jgi:4'-phosphopantetheinyl transferase EntD
MSARVMGEPKTPAALGCGTIPLERFEGFFGKHQFLTHADPSHGSGLSVASCNAGQEEPLFPGEEALAKNWAPGRRKEFAMGRTAARQALEALGNGSHEILRDSTGAPLWPKGFTGSISHTGSKAIAIVGPQPPWQGLGIDLETIGRVQPRLWRLLFSESEKNWLQALDTEAQTLAASLLFSAKEAFYKMQCSLGGSWLGFLDVEVRPRETTAKQILFDPAHKKPTSLELTLKPPKTVNGHNLFHGIGWFEAKHCGVLFTSKTG